HAGERVLHDGPALEGAAGQGLGAHLEPAAEPHRQRLRLLRTRLPALRRGAVVARPPHRPAGRRPRTGTAAHRGPLTVTASRTRSGEACGAPLAEWIGERCPAPLDRGRRDTSSKT